MSKGSLFIHAPLVLKGAWFFFAWILPGISMAAPLSAEQLILDADEAYDQGDCKKAIELYQKILSNPAITLEDRSVSEFRKAYCHSTLGESTRAEKHFRNYLKWNPKDEEARLRYSESLFEQGKWTEVIQAAAGAAKSGKNVELTLLLGRSYLELKEAEQAISYFAKISEKESIMSQAQYWWAVAEYQRGNKTLARNHFEKSILKKNGPDWVQSYAKDWIMQIDRELSLLKGSLGLAYFYDGNLGFSSTQAVNLATHQPQINGPNESSYLKDHGLLISSRLYGTLAESHPWSVTYALDASLPYYFNYSGYNNQILGASIAIHYVENSKLKYGFDAHYLDSRYNYQYYQDYLTLTPSVVWLPSSKWSLYFYAPCSLYLLSRNSTLFSPSLTAKYQAFGPLSLSVGANFSSSSGTAATYTNTNPAYVASGTMFVNYTTIGGNFGLGLQLPWGLYLSAQTGAYHSAYAAESPPNVVAGEARSDTLVLSSADLYFEAIADRLSFDLSYSQYNNSSNGFQGIPYGTTMSTYNYQRPYLVLSTTLNF